jgi:uncharacterized protein
MAAAGELDNAGQAPATLPPETPICGRRPPWWLWWPGLAAAATVAGFCAQSLRLPGSWLVGSVVVSTIASLIWAEHPSVGLSWFRVVQSVIGMVLASTFRPDVLPLVVVHAVPVVLTVAVTLGVSILAGRVLSRVTMLSRETATFGTLPGGASGMIAMSRDANADTRMVALMQYSRMVIVVLSASLLARFVFRSPVLIDATSAALGAPASLPTQSWGLGLLSILLGGAGSLAGVLLRIPAGALLGSLMAGIAASQLGWLHAAPPPFLPQAAYLVMGMYVGLLFDREALGQAGRVLPFMLANIVVLITACAFTGGLLSMVTHTNHLTGYLATTPGGLDSVAVVALGSGGDVSLVLAVQMVRLFAVIFAGPLLARLVIGRRSPGDRGPEPLRPR